MDGQAGNLANPFAFHLIHSIKVLEKLELVGRYGYIDADNGVGIDISSTYRRSPEPSGAGFDRAESIYLGFNWYESVPNIRVSAGYEWVFYSDELGTVDEDFQSHGLRIRFQIVF